MEGKFIYVFTESMRDEMISNHYKLIHAVNGMYVFENNPRINFAKTAGNCVYSDTLVFA